MENNILEESDYLMSSEGSGQEPRYEQLYIHEILMGKPERGFKGIFPLIRAFMDLKEYKQAHKDQIEQILDFLLARAKGEVPTGARFIREFVM